MSTMTPSTGETTGTRLRTVLNVGCGPKDNFNIYRKFKGPDWKIVRLDINPDFEPDYCCDMRDMSPVPDNSMDAVWSSHNLEHLYAHEVKQALSEFYRVLKVGGFLFITMPDLQSVAKHVAEGNLETPLYHSPAGPISALDILYGHRGNIAHGNYFMAHKTGFTKNTLGEKMSAAGFSQLRIKSDNDFNLWALGFKLTDPQQPVPQDPFETILTS